MISERVKEELKKILEEEYGLKLKPQVLSEVADGLFGFFGLLAGIDYQTKKGKGSHREKRVNQY